VLRRSTLCLGAHVLDNPRVVARDESGPRYRRKARLLSGFVACLSSRGRAFDEKVGTFLRHTREEVRRTGRLARAGTDLEKTGLALRKTYKELRAVPRRPTEYEAQLKVWLGIVNRAASHFERAGKALTAGHQQRPGTCCLASNFPQKCSAPRKRCTSTTAALNRKSGSRRSAVEGG
jgi:hypothetical protein